MKHETAKAIRKLKHINIRGIVARITFIFLISVFSYSGYVYIQSQKLENILSNKRSLLEKKEEEYAKITSDALFRKYQSAQILYNSDDFLNRKKTIIALVAMFNDIRNVKKNVSGLELGNFKINIDGNIYMTGTIQNIRSIYAKGGLIDNFLDFNFVEYINIPYYRKNEDGYFEFSLNAILTTNDTSISGGTE